MILSISFKNLINNLLNPVKQKRLYLYEYVSDFEKLKGELAKKGFVVC